MSERRFHIVWNRGGHDEPGPVGWVICDRRRQNLRITIAYANYGEAEVHRDNIAALYLRFGW